MSTVSVIIPTYNRAHLLPRALTSVFRQSLACDEVIVVDDGSNDATPALLQAIQAEAPTPITLHILCQENRGAAAARNAGIKHARGDLIAFLDADDWWLPEKLALQVAAMERESGYRISHTREIWYRRGERVMQKKRQDPPGGFIFYRSLDTCLVAMSTVMARKELFSRYGHFDESLPCCEDYEFWLRIGRVEPFLLLEQALTCRDGGRPDQLSSIHRMGMDQYRIRALHQLIESGRFSPEQDKAARRELARKCAIYGQGCRKHGRPDEAGRYFKLAANYGAGYAVEKTAQNPAQLHCEDPETSSCL
ncbi:MAG: glycosyltransferase family A protein [bacterium]|nr:glycosyltransferase family A protein [bacterium]